MEKLQQRAYELIYDEKQTRIIGINELDMTTLLPHFDGKDRVWVQYMFDPNKKRILFDAQVQLVPIDTSLVFD